MTCSCLRLYSAAPFNFFPLSTGEVELMNLVSSNTINKTAEYYKGILVKVGCMLISWGRNQAMLINLFPAEVFQVKSVHLVIAITVGFAPSVNIKLVIVNNWSVVRNFPWTLGPGCLYFLPLPSIGICLQLARLNFGNGRNVSTPYWWKCAMTQITATIYEVPTKGY